MRRRFAQHFLSNAPLWAAGLASLLLLPSLPTGLVLDDYSMLLFARDSSRVYPGAESRWLEMFEFASGDPEDNRHAVEIGMSPWWADPHEQLRFFRPLTSIGHYLEYRYLGDMPWLMHLHNVVLYACLVVLAAVLYRRWSSSPLAAGLCAVLFAIDYTHGAAVGWIANRNMILAALFGLLALRAHDDWRSRGARGAVVVAALCFALSLGAAEAGVTTSAYLFAYAIFLDRQGPARALLSLAPYGLLVVAWRVLWQGLGYGAHHYGGYIDPLSAPWGFAQAAADRLPRMLLGEFAAPAPELSLLLGPTGRSVHTWGAVAFVAAGALLFRKTLWRDRRTRFYLTGMLCSLVPFCAVEPGNRVLMFASFGAMGLLGELLLDVRTKARELWPQRIGRMAAVGLALTCGGLHLVLAGPALVYSAVNPIGPRDVMERGLLLEPLAAGDEQRDFVLVNPAGLQMPTLSLVMREAKGLGLPRSLRGLAPGKHPVALRRTDESTLVVRPARGFCESLYCDVSGHLPTGARLQLPGMTAQILKASNNIDEAAFEFEVPLEHDRLRLLRWDGKGFVAFKPPEIGQEVELPGVDIW